MATPARVPSTYNTTLSSRGVTTTTARGNIARPRTSGAGRPSTAASINAGIKDQTIICAISESRGISPTVGLAFVNITTYEAVLCQICDSQTYVKTIHKLGVYGPTEILFTNTASDPQSKLFSIVEDNITDSKLIPLDRKYWAETRGLEYVHQLAFKADLESLKVTLGGNYFATCCFAAVMRYIELNLNVTFTFHSLRIKYEPSEGSMMIDLSTIVSFELIQNLRNAKSKDCLFGLLNETLTPMGSRFLRGSILQPSTDAEFLQRRYDALQELTEKEEMFYAVRQALQSFVDADKILTTLITIPNMPEFQYFEQSINYIIMLKQYVISINPIYEALTGAEHEFLRDCRDLCRPANSDTILDLINDTVNEDIRYQSKPLDLRNQRTYAVKAGVNGFLDVARQTYKEANDDAYEHVIGLGDEFEIALELKFESARQYFIRIPTSELTERPLPDGFINVVRNKKNIECQTLDLMKLNQKIQDSHHEVIKMSNQSIQDLISDVRSHLYILFKISECIAALDTIASFAQVASTQDYVRPELTQTLAIKAGRHPIHEKVHSGTSKFIPNDVYADNAHRFQIITGSNMSGKSTYIRSIALMTVMAQIGCFVPADYASFPIRHHLFARVTASDAEVSANVSTFSAEMREMAFILRNISPDNSMIIIDELGRGTATRDGLHIALAISEALIHSCNLVWFATHFHDLARILAPRPGVVNLHLAVQMSDPRSSPTGYKPAITMLYKISNGPVKEAHYGLVLAQVVGLPNPLIQHATKVSEYLTRISEEKKESATAKVLAIAKKRKLILTLNEQLEQARDSVMEGEVLRNWLQRLKEEFCMRMAAIEAVEGVDGGRPGSGTESSDTVRDDGVSVVETDCAEGCVVGMVHNGESFVEDHVKGGKEEDDDEARKDGEEADNEENHQMAEIGSDANSEEQDCFDTSEELGEESSPDEDKAWSRAR